MRAIASLFFLPAAALLRAACGDIGSLKSSSRCSARELRPPNQSTASQASAAISAEHGELHDPRVVGQELSEQDAA